MKRFVLILLLFALATPSLLAQDKEPKDFTKQIFYKSQYTFVDSSYRDNASSINFILNEIGKIVSAEDMGVSKITIVSGASPDGYYNLNLKFASERAKNIKNAIVTKYPQTESIIDAKSLGIDWEGTIEAVEKSDVQYKEEILKILREAPVLGKANGKTTYPRHYQLRHLKGGVPYRWLVQNLFPDIRKTVVTVYYWKQLPPPPAPEPEPEPEPAPEPAPEPEPQPEPVQPVFAPEPLPQPCFAVKTNYLYDFAATPNIAIEIPIKKKWSIGAEYTFPWWVWSHNARAYQVLYWDVTLRRWLGNRDKKDVLSGWFVGLIGGGGYYDIEPHRSLPHRGYQGWGLTASVEAGYAFYLSDRWSMEFSVAGGYAHTDYAKYKGVLDDEHLVWQHDDHREWWGPTKVNASIVYLIYHKGDKAKRKQLREQRRADR